MIPSPRKEHHGLLRRPHRRRPRGDRPRRRLRVHGSGLSTASPSAGTGPVVVEVDAIADPRLSDYAHRTDVELRNAALGSTHGVYLAESLLVLERALRAGHAPRSVLALGTAVEPVLAVLGDRPVPVFTGPGELLAELTGYVLHRGVIAAMHRPALPDPVALLASARRIVVLENVVDPTNVGAIFRSVAAIGADAVLVTPDCSDPFYRRAIRVSMGTVLQVPWTRAPGWEALGGMLHDAGFRVAALALTPDAVPLAAFAAGIAPDDRVALVLGSEGPGLSAEALAASDARVVIPMRHGIDSLNVAAAAAVAMYALA